jgi:uncharacterized MAPEG superfamily protein
MTYARFTVGALVRADRGAAALCLQLSRQVPGFGKPRSSGGYDNSDPRGWLARQAGWKARADAAQANSFEALPFFIGA